MAISAFKHIRLSGHNLTPVVQNSTLRLGFSNSGLAYYSELTGISGFLRGLIVSSNDTLNNLQGNVYITGQDGINIEVNAGLGEIKIIGNSGYFQNIVNTISNNLFTTGSTLSTSIGNVSNNLFTTGSTLSTSIGNVSNNLYLTGFTLSTSIENVSNNLFTTGSTLSQYNTAYSGWANAEFVKKSTQQVFETALTPINLDEYAVIYPVAFTSTPKIQATLEIPGDVMYNLSVKSIGTAGYTGVLSDNILEAGAKIHTFASTQ